jgi:hypothetical protein
MPVQQIELEEVTIVETPDEALEAVVGRGGVLIWSSGCVSWACGPGC